MNESLFAVYGIGRAYLDMYERLTPLLIRIARKHAQQDETLFDDLMQEARIALWKLDVTRYDRASRRALIRAVKMAMLLAMRRERHHTHAEGRRKKWEALEEVPGGMRVRVADRSGAKNDLSDSAAPGHDARPEHSATGAIL
jgi:DNA-directed RNA polymerase specialized sigma24 family protein